MQELIQEGLSNLCRLCGEDDRECFDLFDDERQEEELLLKIEQAIRIAITQDDGLPTGICTLCHDKITGYATFYLQCHDTQNRLREFLSIECAMQKSIECKQELEATDDDDHLYEGETEEVYYYEEVPDGGMEGVEEMEDMDAVDAEGSYVITEIREDNAEESSLAASEQKKMHPLRDLSPEQKEDSMQTCVKNLRFNEQSLAKSNLNPTGVPFCKALDKAGLDSIAVTTSKQKTNQKQTNIKVTSALVLEPPPLVKISEVAVKTGSPLVQIVKQIVKQIPQTAHPLVPIVKLLSQAKITSEIVNTLPTPCLVPISRTVTRPSLNSKVVKSKLPFTAPSLVPISTSKPKTNEDCIVSRSTKPASCKLLENASTSNEFCEDSKKPSHPQVKIVKAKSGSKGNGRAFIMTDDKTVAVEVDVEKEKSVLLLGKKNDSNLICEPKPQTVNKLVDGISVTKLGKINASNLNCAPKLKTVNEPVEIVLEKCVPKPGKSSNDNEQKASNLNRKRKKTTVNEPVPYVKLRNGDLVPLDDVEKVPLDHIPIPPVILMCSSDSDKNMPEVFVKESMTFSEISSSPAVKLSSGLFVSNFPPGLPHPVKVLPNPSTSVTSDTKKTHIFVLKNSSTSQPRKKKKIIAVRSRPTKGHPKASCPEAASQVEDLLADPPQFRCKVCGVILSNKKRCEYHVISKHLKEKCAFECVECGKKFATNFLRTQHIKIKHTRAPDYICSVCGAKFRTIAVLKGHEMRHTSLDPPFKCDFCGKGFYTKANCTKHSLDVHMEKTAVCDICGESFAGVGRLNEHRNNHIGGFKCGECEKTFNSKGRLRAHRRVHNTSKLMLCNCGKKFATFAFLHNHSKVCQKRLNRADSPEAVPLIEMESYQCDTDVD